MTWANVVCGIFTALTCFGFGMMAGRDEDEPLNPNQTVAYLILIALGISGMCL